MTHADATPASPCPGTIRPRYYRTTDGRWKRRTGWMCSVCHRHFFMDADGQMVAGFNLAERLVDGPESSTLESTSHTTKP